MSDSGLLRQITYDKAYRSNRLNAAHWVLQHPETIPELLNYCFGNDKKLATKASWTLEFVCREDITLLYPHLNIFIANLPKAEGDGAVRAVALICELLAIEYYKKKNTNLIDILTKEHKAMMTECCFDWMISNQKVACQARAMLVLYFLGTETDWIHSELHAILTKDLPTGSAGYKSRGGKILERIRAFKASKK